MKKFRYLLHCLHVLWILRNAKRRFIWDRKSLKPGDGSITNHGMCYYLSDYVRPKTYKNPLTGQEWDYIPEFCPGFFGLYTRYINDNYKIRIFYGDYWWPLEDMESRIKAFDKLIDVYKNKVKELLRWES